MGRMSFLTGLAGKTEKTTTGFQQHDNNIAKAGAYYTDLHEARKIGRQLKVEAETEEVSVLEPSIGNGLAVLSATESFSEKRKIYGVELRRDAAKETAQNSNIECVLTADFLTDVVISNNAFALGFANPPYGASSLTDGGRLETEFLCRIRNYLAGGGILVWIVPLAAVADTGHMEELFLWWDIRKVFRFSDPEYEKYHQIVFFLKKRTVKFTQHKEEALAFRLSHAKKEDFTVLPDDCEEADRIVIPKITRTVTTFKTRKFDHQSAFEALSRLDESGALDYYRKLQVEDYGSKTELRPPMEINRDSMHMCMVSGIGSGLAGSGEDGTVHLQRGNIQRSEESSYEPGKEKGIYVIRTRTYAKAYVTVIEPDGTVTRLE